MCFSYLATQMKTPVERQVKVLKDTKTPFRAFAACPLDSDFLHP
jgi:hypothetical protein